MKIFKAEANRDPDRYADPDRLDLARTPNPHLSFGHGRHYCPAANLVLDQVLLGLTARFARIEPGEPQPTGGPQHTGEPQQTGEPEAAWDSYDGKPLLITFQE